MPDVKFQTISASDWENMPKPTRSATTSPWDTAIETLLSGEMIAIPLDNEQDVRGARIGIARRASKAYGAKLDFRYDAKRKLLAIRLKSRESGENGDTGEAGTTDTQAEAKTRRR